MKIGFMVPRESDFAEGQDPYARIYDMCQMAEDLGFDFATFTHHRFSPDRPYISAPFILMSGIAARTTRLELITTIFILPLYQPLDVAEQVASLDRLSGGRVVLGVGAGYRPYEAEAVGVPYDKRIGRMTESIAILREAWTQERASFQGTHFSFEDVPVVPKPVREPHPPIWIGALAPAPIERAGRIADGWIAPALQTFPVLQERAELYRATAAAHGRPATICLERDVAVSQDGEAARQAWVDRNLEYIEHFREHGAPVLPGAISEPADLGRDLAVSGTPEDCIRELQRYRDEFGCEYLSTMNLGLGPGYGNPGNFEHELRAMELFGKEVLPALRP